MRITPMVFEKANELTAEATTTVKGAIMLAAIAFIAWLLFKREGTAKLVMAGATAAIAIWLVAFDGISVVAGWFGATLES